MKTTASVLTQVQAGDFFGIAKGLPHADHIAAKEYLSNSGMTPLLKSPAHYQAYLTEERVTTKAQNMGTATHLAILERALDQIAAEPKADGRTSEGKKIKAQFALENIGKVIVTQDELTALIGMSKAVHAHKEASRCFAGGVAETSIFWQDPEFGVRLKARPDYVNLDAREFIDLKTTEDASANFGRSAFNYGYFRQAALYSDGIEAVYGFRPVFKIVAVEKSAPYGVSVFKLTEAALAYGRLEARKAIKIYAECWDSGEWPCYLDGVQLLDVPSFAW